MADAAAPPPIITQTTVLSLLFTVAVLGAAYALSVRVLPANASKTTRTIYIWHLFDFLIHTIFEGSFLYYSLTASSPASSSSSRDSTHPAFRLWGDTERAYGAAHSTAPLALMWQEYTLADRRWGHADVGIVSLEVLTVCVGGPLALWISEMVRRGEEKRWFWITVLAVAELYGGWMTFAPEWFSGNWSLDTGNALYLWVYLFFFNTLWVWIPLWLLVQSYRALMPALELNDVVHTYSSPQEQESVREGVRFVKQDDRNRRGSFFGKKRE